MAKLARQEREAPYEPRCPDIGLQAAAQVAHLDAQGLDLGFEVGDGVEGTPTPLVYLLALVAAAGVEADRGQAGHPQGIGPGVSATD